MDSILVSKDHTGVLSGLDAEQWAFGLLCRAFAEQIMARTGCSEGLYREVALELLQEEGESAPQPPQHVFNIDLSLILKAIRGEAERNRAKPAAEKLIEHVIHIRERQVPPARKAPQKETAFHRSMPAPFDLRTARQLPWPARPAAFGAPAGKTPMERGEKGAEQHIASTVRRKDAAIARPAALPYEGRTAATAPEGAAAFRSTKGPQPSEKTAAPGAGGMAGQGMPVLRGFTPLGKDAFSPAFEAAGVLAHWDLRLQDGHITAPAPIPAAAGPQQNSEGTPARRKTVPEGAEETAARDAGWRLIPSRAVMDGRPATGEPGGRAYSAAALPMGVQARDIRSIPTARGKRAKMAAMLAAAQDANIPAGAAEQSDPGLPPQELAFTQPDASAEGNARIQEARRAVRTPQVGSAQPSRTARPAAPQPQEQDATQPSGRTARTAASGKPVMPRDGVGKAIGSERVERQPGGGRQSGFNEAEQRGEGRAAARTEAARQSAPARAERQAGEGESFTERSAQSADGRALPGGESRKPDVSPLQFGTAPVQGGEGAFLPAVDRLQTAARDIRSVVPQGAIAPDTQQPDASADAGRLTESTPPQELAFLETEQVTSTDEGQKLPSRAFAMAEDAQAQERGERLRAPRAGEGGTWNITAAAPLRAGNIGAPEREARDIRTARPAGKPALGETPPLPAALQVAGGKDRAETAPAALPQELAHSKTGPSAAAREDARKPARRAKSPEQRAQSAAKHPAAPENEPEERSKGRGIAEQGIHAGETPSARPARPLPGLDILTGAHADGIPSLPPQELAFAPAGTPSQGDASMGMPPAAKEVFAPAGRDQREETDAPGAGREAPSPIGRAARDVRSVPSTVLGTAAQIAAENAVLAGQRGDALPLPPQQLAFADVLAAESSAQPKQAGTRAGDRPGRIEKEPKPHQTPRQGEGGLSERTPASGEGAQQGALPMQGIATAGKDIRTVSPLLPRAQAEQPQAARAIEPAMPAEGEAELLQPAAFGQMAAAPQELAHREREGIPEGSAAAAMPPAAKSTAEKPAYAREPGVSPKAQRGDMSLLRAMPSISAWNPPFQWGAAEKADAIGKGTAAFRTATDGKTQPAAKSAADPLFAPDASFAFGEELLHRMPKTTGAHAAAGRAARPPAKRPSRSEGRAGVQSTPDGRSALTSRAPAGSAAAKSSAESKRQSAWRWAPADGAIPGAGPFSETAGAELAYGAGLPPVALALGPSAQSFSQGSPAKAESSAGFMDSDYVKSLPAWAQRFLKSGAAEGVQGGATAIAAAKDISVLPKPKEETEKIDWTAPARMQRPAEMNLRKKEEQKEHPAPAQLSEAELRRAADRIYRMIEDRIRRERRRLGL